MSALFLYEKFQYLLKYQISGASRTPSVVVFHNENGLKVRKTGFNSASQILKFGMHSRS
jgi:hypothetical protein